MCDVHLLQNRTALGLDEGLNIPEVAHDYQATIKQCVQQLGMVNSYDTWHGKVSIFVFSGELIGVIAGTKNVAKQLRPICAGTVRTRDRTWFTELSDKGTYVLSGHIDKKWNIWLFSKVHQGALVLVHEELWWQP